jgi:GntR family transcriptional regulator
MPLIEPVYKRIAREFTVLIETGQLRPGDALPSIKEIVEQYRTSKSTVQRALSLLDDRGLIESHQGKAVYVRHDR